jgi:hypothetical protein
MNIAEQLKLNYCNTKVLNEVVGRDPYNTYNLALHDLKIKQEAGDLVSDIEYEAIPCCGAAYYWSAAHGYYSVNFHYNFFHPEYINKAELIDQFIAFLGVVPFIDCRESEVINWCSSFKYFVNSCTADLSEDYKTKCDWIINILNIIDPIKKYTTDALDTVDRSICSKVFDNAIWYFKQKEQEDASLANRYSGSMSLKAKDVMSLLGISRQTLSTYVKQGLVKVDSTVNGKYRYNKESVFALVNSHK